MNKDSCVLEGLYKVLTGFRGGLGLGVCGLGRMSPGLCLPGNEGSMAVRRLEKVCDLG